MKFNKKEFVNSFLVVLFLTMAVKSVFPGIFIEPYLQNVTQDGITILWWTDDSQLNSRVEYGVDFGNVEQATNEYIASEGKYLHSLTLTGLENGYYNYRVRSGPFISNEYKFRTAMEPDSSFNFVILGDGRTDNDTVIQNHRAITNLAWNQKPEIAFHLGDMVYSGDQIQWERFWRRIVTRSDTSDPGIGFASEVPYYLVLGNHEIYSSATGYDEGNLSTTMDRFKSYVHNPTNGSVNQEWDERYYCFKYGVATFIILDVNNTNSDFYDNNKALPDNSTPNWEPGSEQYLWLIDKLYEAQQSSAFTFVMMHPAPYSRGIHGKPGQSLSGWDIRALDPLFRQYGVDAVFSGHDHTVERCLTGPAGFENLRDKTDPHNLNYFVQGNSGHSARDPESGWETWMDIKENDSSPYYSEYFYDWNGTDHFSFLNIVLLNKGDGNWQSTFQVIRDDGEIFDSFSLERHDPSFSVPVELSSLSASIHGNSVQLNWTTCSESNNFGFEVQISSDKILFQKKGFVRGHGTTSLPQKYNFLDKHKKPKMFYYRLKQLDFDGGFKYSLAVEANLSTAVPNSFDLFQNYPNPFNTNTNLTFFIPNKMKVKLEVYNINGELIRTLVKSEMKAGKCPVFWDGTDQKGRLVANGYYFYKLSTNEISRTKKMLKLKY